MINPRSRVFLCITRRSNILVLDHVDQNNVPLQIPGGTIEVGEQPHIAAIREAQEETGLCGFEEARPLGRETVLVGPAASELVDGWFFHLRYDRDTPDRWIHAEDDASSGESDIRFELRWIPIQSEVQLGVSDLRFLDHLKRHLSRGDV